MKAAILSAGVNRRLAELQKPKGLLEMGGQTLLSRTLSALDTLGFSEVFCVIRNDASALEQYLKNIKLRFRLILVKNNSRNPYYSLMALGDRLSDGEGVLTFNVDAVYDCDDLQRFVEHLKEPRYLDNKDMIMWASPYVKDVNDDPAYMTVTPDGCVTDYGKDIEPSDRVFGQVRYCSARILRLRKELHARHITHMKPFISYLIQNQYPVYAYRTNKPVYDIDTPVDIENVTKIMKNAKL